MDYGMMLYIVFFLSSTPGTLMARFTESLAMAPSGLLSETHNKSAIKIWIGDHTLVIVAVVVAMAVVVAVLICDWKARPSNPGSLVTYRAKDLTSATNNFSDANLIGEGGFARVYLADFGHYRAAVKKILNVNVNVDPTSFSKELAVLLMLPRHRNLVNLLGICSDQDNQMIVFEYVANGNLFTRLHEYQGDAGPLSWASRKKIARQIAEALKHLHEQANPPIIHRDVKSKNVLLENDFSAKLADFGIAKLGPKNNQSTRTTPCGTPGYIDPQYYLDGSCSTKSDVYSYGVLLLELITGKRAVNGDENLVNCTREDRLSTSPRRIMTIVDQSLADRNIGKELRKTIRIANKCLESNRDDRPLMAEVVNMMGRIKNAT